jgi:hypothetical protein
MTTSCISDSSLFEYIWWWFVVWSSSWVRTLFFNSTQPDEQNPKSSPRARTPELAQGSGADRIACSAQLVEQIWSFNPRVDYSIRDFCMSRNSDWVLDEQVCLFDSIRRTRTRIRSILLNKNSNPFNSFGQKECAQPCPTLGLNARARAQLNPTATLISRSNLFWMILKILCWISCSIQRMICSNYFILQIFIIISTFQNVVYVVFFFLVFHHDRKRWKLYWIC